MNMNSIGTSGKNSAPLVGVAREVLAIAAVSSIFLLFAVVNGSTLLLRPVLYRVNGSSYSIRSSMVVGIFAVVAYGLRSVTLGGKLSDLLWLWFCWPHMCSVR